MVNGESQTVEPLTVDIKHSFNCSQGIV